MKRFYRNVRAIDVAVLDLDQPGSGARRLITDECRRALEEDAADAIVLGCAGMADLGRAIEDAIGADSVVVSVKLGDQRVGPLVNAGLCGAQ